MTRARDDEPKRGLTMVARLRLSTILAGLLVIPAGCGSDSDSDDEGGALDQANALLAKMTLDDKITLVTGTTPPAGNTHRVAGFIAAIQHDDVDIPGLFLNDGPNGVGNGATGVTRYPTGITVAASWSRDVARAFGDAVGGEWAGKGSNIGLGPGMNLDRLPYNGRTAEYYSEDPYLSGQIGAQQIQGIQGHNVIATAKHYAVNNQETDRSGGNSILSERTLRELYLPQFEAAVKEGGVGAIMCSYNRVNGTYACENSHLLSEILRDDWGFTGFVMSDWGALHSTAPSANAGVDMDMPGTLFGNIIPVRYGDDLGTAVGAGEVSQEVLDDMVRRILATMFRVGLFDHRNPVTEDVSTEERKAVAQSMAEEGTVLLKNEGGVLPLARTLRIAVIGGAADAYAQSAIGGSGAVNPSETIVTPLAGIEAAAADADITYSLGSYGTGTLPLMTSADGPGRATLGTSSGDPGFDLVIRDSEGVAQLTTTSADVYRVSCVFGPCDTQLWPAPYDDFRNQGWTAEFTSTLTIGTAQTYLFTLTGVGTTTLTIDDAEAARVESPDIALTRTFRVMLSAGTHSVNVTLDTTTYTWPRAFGVLDPQTPTVSLNWDPQGDPRTAALEAAAAADVAIVCVSDAQTEGADHPASLPGDQDELVAAVAGVAKRTVVVMNTGSAIVLPWADQVDAIVQNWYGGQRMGTAIARILFGDVNPSGKLPVTFPVSESQLYARETSQYPGVAPAGSDHLDVHYDEGIMVGYRWFDSNDLEPLFPFGHGLSYTTFAYDDLRVTPEQGDGSEVTVTATVTNTGQVAGKEVAQLYVGFPAASGEPPRQLKGFDKIALEPGASAEVTFTLDSRSFSYWDEGEAAWTIAPGTYTIWVGTSSRDPSALSASFTVP